MPFTGIILAGGKSSRMGTEKGLVLYKGKPLISYALDVLNQLCDEILISANNKSYDHMGYKVIPDSYPGIGPMGGIHSCLLESKNRINLVISCDMPFITADIYQHLLSQAGDSWICVPWYEDNHYEPLCGLYLKDCLPDMKQFIDQRNFKLPDLFLKTKFKAAKVIDILPPVHQNYFMNVNSPSDLEAAQI
jgi:molybdopterin-guanine dinucleotide biosynthesis protein A